MKILAGILTGTLAAAPVLAGDLVEVCKTNFRKDFPRTHVEEVVNSPIEGICEIHSGTNVFYYVPPSDQKKGMLIVGGIMTADGKNLTDKVRQELVAKANQKLLKKAEKLPLDKAVRVGKGEVELIVFTDPDCPYCRRLEKFLNTPGISKKVTRYVFFYPLKMHKNAPKKSEWILEQSDMAKALEDVMISRVLDTGDIKISGDKSEVLEDHIRAAKEMGVSGTPMIIVKGKGVVRGANLRLLQTYIGEAHAKLSSSLAKADCQGCP